MIAQETSERDIKHPPLTASEVAKAVDEVGLKDCDELIAQTFMEVRSTLAEVVVRAHREWLRRRRR